MSSFSRSLVCRAACAALFATTLSAVEAQQIDLDTSNAFSAIPVITLARNEGAARIAGADKISAAATEAERDIHAAKANLREFAKVNLRESSPPEQFVLQFHAAAKLTRISAGGDFQVTGGNCAEGRAYQAEESCALEVTFTPTGPGHRTGQLKVEHTASAIPFLAPLGGTAYGPAISFTPSLIATVAGTNLGGSTGGLISGPGQLATDGGDNLYVADPGNHLLRMKDSSGVLTTIVGGGTASLTSNTSGFGTKIKLSAPTGVAVDFEGNVYFSDNIDKLIGTYFLDTIAVRSVGLGATAENSCNTGSKCTPSAVALDPPTTLAIDSSGNVFSAEIYGNTLPGSEIAEWTPLGSPSQFYETGTNAYNYYSTSNAITTDPFGYGNLYYTYLDPGGSVLSPTPVCYILGQNSAYTQNTSGSRFWTVAGSGKCGFSGDGGRAASAEISKAVGQFAWDLAGNFYFTDTGNNRVRRVDATTSVIHTIAGSGSNGSNGDGGTSTAAQLQTPLGLATDSTGRVYVTGITGAANKYDIRMFGTVGALSFGSAATGSHSTAQTVMVSNVGNSSLNFTHTGFSSGNASDFAIDPNTTSCNFTVPLLSGHSCNVGFIFTPSAAGARSATLTLLDDTTTGSNTIQLTGTGATTATLAPTAVTYASRAVNSPSAATAVTLKNTGTGLLTINSIAISGSGAASFSKTTNCATTLAAGASCSISVTFKPTTTGAISATLSVNDNALGGSQTLALSGTATAAAKAALAPGAIAFATQEVGTASASKVISIKNITTTAMSLNSFTITGPNSPAFTQKHGCGQTLAAGASCTVSVVFKPAAVGARNASLTVNTSSGPLTAPLSGMSVASTK